MSAKVIRFPKQSVPTAERKANPAFDQLRALMDDVKAGRPPPEDEHGRRGYELAQRIMERIAAAAERRK